MRISISLLGNDILGWKVGCDDYLPDNLGFRDGANNYDYVFSKKDTELGMGDERICVLSRNKYRHYHGVCSCVETWLDTIAVTK